MDDVDLDLAFALERLILGNQLHLALAAAGMMANLEQKYPTLKDLAASFKPAPWHAKAPTPDPPAIKGRSLDKIILDEVQLSDAWPGPPLTEVIMQKYIEDYAKEDAKLTYELIKGREKNSDLPYDTLPSTTSFDVSWKVSFDGPEGDEVEGKDVGTPERTRKP